VELADLVTIKQLHDGANIDIGDADVRVLKNVHPPIDESFALRFEWDGKVVVLSGDTAFMPEMINFAKDADLLVHEAMLMEGLDTIMARQSNGDERLRHHLIHSHTVAQDVGRIAAEANVKTLALNHFVPDGFPEFGEAEWSNATQETWAGDLIIGRDGMRIPL